MLRLYQQAGLSIERDIMAGSPWKSRPLRAAVAEPMDPSEMDALVERIGDEILARLGRLPVVPSASPAALGAVSWPRPAGGHAARLEACATGLSMSAGAVEQLCVQAAALGLRALWTAASWTPRALRALAGSKVRLGATVGFPWGDAPPAAKRAEAEIALSNGAVELLTTLDAGAWRSGEWDRVYADLRGVCDVAAGARAPVAVAIAAAPLDEAALLKAAIAAKLAGATAVYVAGWSSGRRLEPARLRRLHEAIGDDLALGVWDEADHFGAAAAWVAAGADRLASRDPAAVLAGAPRD